VLIKFVSNDKSFNKKITFLFELVNGILKKDACFKNNIIGIYFKCDYKLYNTYVGFKF